MRTCLPATVLASVLGLPSDQRSVQRHPRHRAIGVRGESAEDDHVHAVGERMVRREHGPDWIRRDPASSPRRPRTRSTAQGGLFCTPSSRLPRPWPSHTTPEAGSREGSARTPRSDARSRERESPRPSGRAARGSDGGGGHHAAARGDALGHEVADSDCWQIRGSPSHDAVSRRDRHARTRQPTVAPRRSASSRGRDDATGGLGGVWPRGALSGIPSRASIDVDRRGEARNPCAIHRDQAFKDHPPPPPHDRVSLCRRGKPRRSRADEVGPRELPRGQGPHRGGPA